MSAIVQNSIMIPPYKNTLFCAILGLSVLFGFNSLPLQAQTFNLTPTIQQKTFTTSDQVKLQYLIGGSGSKTLFFIPGWLMPAEVFNAQLNYFANSYRVISFSPRSQGKSDIYLGANLAELRARDIKELIAATQTSEVTLIGWSLGVMEALDYVNRYGSQGINGLVLIDNSIGEGTPPKTSVVKKSAPMNSDSFKKYVKGFVGAIFKSNPPPEFIRTVENSALRLAAKPENAFAILRKPYSREYYRDTLYNTQVPIWYAITPRYSEQALLMSEKHPLGEFKIYENDAGHALFVDKAEEFNLDLENFLRKLN